MSQAANATENSRRRMPLVRVGIVLVGTILLCAWLRSWRSWPSAVYDLSLGVSLFGYLGETFILLRRARLERRRVAMLAALAAACAVAAGRVLIGYSVPISGHMTILTTVLGLALWERRRSWPRLSYYALPWVAVLLVRWFVFDWTHHWQTIGAVGTGALLVVLAWLAGVWAHRRPLRWIVLVVGTYLLACGGVGAFVAEGALRPARSRNDPSARARLAASGSVEDVEVTAGGIRQHAWYVVPPNDRGSAVLVLHGIGDRRSGMVGHAVLLAKHGYRVLLADLRAHGDSEGDLSTYGVLEAQDAAAWQRWLTVRGARCVFGLGASLGGAVLLQAPRVGAQLCGVAAEGAYASFSEVAADRVAAASLGRSWLARLLVRPVVAAGALTMRLRYGIDLGQASPMDAVAATRTPVLLVHGDADTDTPPRHSVVIREAARADVELWSVPGARHCGALGHAPEEFERRVVGWLDERER